MQSLIHYFSTAPDSHRVILLGIALVLFWNVENWFAFILNYKKWKHALVNATFIFPAMPIQFLLGIAVIKTLNWDAARHWGILNAIPHLTNPFLLFIASFILLDFFEYVYHVIMHKVKRLWMFHLVHHSDRVVDSTTTLREHPGETLVRLSFLVLWVFLSGVCFWVFLFRQFIQITDNVFVHSNFRINEKVNQVLELIFITPNMHQVHHHYKQPYTDCNYGDMLSIWDRMFGTFKQLSKEEIVFGIDNYMDENENGKIVQLAKIPFGKYRAPTTEVDD